MNSIKCSSCGLVNFAGIPACKRCGVPFNGDPLAMAATMSAASSTTTPTAHVVAALETSYAQPDVQVESGQHMKRILFGALWFGGGSILTLAGYNSASGGGKYIVFWGAIVFGLIDMLRGVAGLIGGKEG